MMIMIMIMIMITITAGITKKFPTVSFIFMLMVS